MGLHCLTAMFSFYGSAVVLFVGCQNIAISFDIVVKILIRNDEESVILDRPKMDSLVTLLSKHHNCDGEFGFSNGTTYFQVLKRRPTNRFTYRNFAHNI